MTATEEARNYYDSPFAMSFYDEMWGGGGNIHVGLYRPEDPPSQEGINAAAERLVKHMGSLCHLRGTTLDLGCGFGGPSRIWEQQLHAPIVGLNISEEQNAKNANLNDEAGSNNIIVQGDFHHLPFVDRQFHNVLSIDSFLHADDRRRVLEEASRVLCSAGMFVFTDLMLDPSAPEEDRKPLLDRIRLADMATPDFYTRELRNQGFWNIEFEDHTDCMARHYGLLADLLVNDDTAEGAKMREGCRLWERFAKNRWARWGIFQATRQ